MPMKKMTPRSTKKTVKKAAPKVGKAMPRRGGFTGSAKPSSAKPMKRGGAKRGVPSKPGSRYVKKGGM